MSKASLQAAPRGTNRPSDLKELRRRGLVPSVVYGFGKEAERIQVDVDSLKPLLMRRHGATLLIDLSLEGKDDPVVTVIREVQRHPVTRDLIHCDFLRVDLERKYQVSVPVILTGEPIGVKNSGGVLDQHVREIEIRCRPTEIPEQYEIDVSDLDMGDSIRVGEIPHGEEEFITHADVAVVTIAAPRKLAEEEAPAEAEAVGEEGAVPGEEGAAEEKGAAEGESSSS